MFISETVEKNNALSENITISELLNTYKFFSTSQEQTGNISSLANNAEP